MSTKEPDHSLIEWWQPSNTRDFKDPESENKPRWFNLVNIPKLTEIPQYFDKTISVVITNWRYTQWLSYAIGSIIYQDFPHDMLEIIVVDDNSGDNVYEVMEEIKDIAIYHCYDTQLSFYETHKNVTHNIALAFNIGCKRAQNDIIINSPADCFQRGDFLKTVSRYHTYFASCGTRTAISANILCKNPSHKPKSIFEYKNRPTTDVGLTARREDYHNIKGYDERFRGWGGSEPDITGRMGISGVGLATCPNLVIASSLGPSLMKVIFHDGVPDRKQRFDNPDHGMWSGNDNNHKLSGENSINKNYCPNKEWGELDTLEKVF